MLNEAKTPKTSHTLNKVPFVMANAPKGFSLRRPTVSLVTSLPLSSRSWVSTSPRR